MSGSEDRWFRGQGLRLEGSGRWREHARRQEEPTRLVEEGSEEHVEVYLQRRRQGQGPDFLELLVYFPLAGVAGWMVVVEGEEVPADCCSLARLELVESAVLLLLT